jgi:ubiquinone/menaquinone biosynthesis C-methylase UbiE/dienelactone hydrolase
VAAVICPPWGWDEVASYRARRQWAESLSSRGVTTLRFDLPGTGDSAGGPADGDQVAAWLAAIESTARWLAALPGVESLLAIGLGVGGLLTLAAVDVGAPIDEVVLWAVPPRGRRYVRGLRAFSGTQASRLAPGPDETPALPDGWLEVNGFALHADTVTSLSGLDARELATGRLRRALVISQDGMDDGESLASHLESRDVAVSRSRAKGWADLVVHPEQTALAPAVIGEIDRWLALPTPHLDRPLPVLAPPDHCYLDDVGGAIVDTALPFDSPDGELFAIASESRFAKGPPDVCIVFLNAGAVRRIGPNRLWVTAARRWASLGVPSLRVDLEGIGDGFGPDTHPAGVADLYDARRAMQVQRAIDLAVQRWSPRHVVLVGLCAGGYWAFRGAQVDSRVTGCVLLNPGALEWHADTSARHRVARLRKLRHPEQWLRVLRGQVRWQTMRSALSGVVGVLRALPTRLAKRIRGESDPPESAARGFESLDQMGTRVILAFSDDEVLERELERTGLLGQLVKWPGVDFRRLPGVDHTLRPPAAQRAALELLDEMIQTIRQRAPHDDPEGATMPPVTSRTIPPAEDKNRAVFDRVAASYTDRTLAPTERVLLARLAPTLGAMDMLELGVGTGRTAYTFAPLVRRYVGLDYSPAMLAQAETLLAHDTNVELVLGDARDLSCVDGPFDLVTFSFNGIDAVSYDDRQLVLAQVAKNLRAGGWFMFSSHSTMALPLATKKVRSPRLMRSRVYRSYARVDDVRYWWKVRRVNRDLQLDQARSQGWTIVKNFGHGFQIDDCYVEPSHQVEVLEHLGFQGIELFDREGRPVTATDPGDTPWLHYLCRSAD